MTDTLMTIEQAARYLSLSRSTIYELIGDGDLPVVRFCRAVRIEPSQLRALVDRWREACSAPAARAAGEEV